MKINKALKQLNWLEDRIGGCLRISNASVPHLLLLKNNIVYSICYFGKGRKFRIFYPYRSDEQKKLDLKLREDVVKYFKSNDNIK
jgi:hypothetical protein